MLTKDDLQQIREVVRDEVQTEVEPLKQGQVWLEQGQAQIKTAVEAIAAGQQDLRANVKTVEATITEVRAELKTDILTIDKKLVRKVQSHENRIDQLERETGIPHPDKH